MKKNARSFALVISALLLALVMIVEFDSCKKKEEPVVPTPSKPEPVSPEPVNGELPESVLPDTLKNIIGEYFTIYSGENPVKVVGQFVSHPHALLATNTDSIYNVNDSVIYFYDRYLCFERASSGLVNFYGQQWDDSLYYDYDHNVWVADYYEEVYRNLNSVGEGDKFTCYFFTEGYPDGMYAKQSTIFSGRWDESYGGLKDFQVAVILLETSGNPNLDPVNSYRVLGDFDGLARDTTWMQTKAFKNSDIKVDDRNAFRLFRKK